MSPAPPVATAHLLRQLREAGALTPAKSAALEALLRDRLAWRAWAEAVLLVLGAALTLAGVIFFFAYNWSDLSPATKFGVVEVSLVLAAAAAWRVGLETLSGKVAIFFACVLTGVFLAIHGQIYQTGADSWLLFAAWAVFILPWTLLARFAALWMFWLVLIETAAWLLWLAGGWSFFHLENLDLLLIALGAMNGAALIAREIAVARGKAYLAEGWVRSVLITLAFIFLGASTCWFIVSPGEESSAFSLVLLLAASAGAYHFYREKEPSLACLSVVILTACIVLVTALAKELLRNSSGPGALFGMVLFVSAVFGAAVAWLRREGMALSQRKEASLT